MIDFNGFNQITAAVIQDGKITWMLEQEATSQTRFSALRELFIIIGVMQAIDDLHAGDISPHHLMTHTSGYGSLRGLIFRNAPLKQHQPAGEKWCYSADNIALLHEMLPPDHLQNAIFTPLGMDQTSETETTLDDMLKLIGELLAPGKIISAERVAQIFTPHYQLHPALPAMGYGFRLEDGMAWMTSDTAGIWIAPQQKTAIVALSDGKGKLSTTCRAAMRQIVPPSTDITAITDAPPLRGGYYAPSAGLLMNLQIWLAYGGGITVGKRHTLNGQMDPMNKIKLMPTTQPDVFLLPSGNRVVIDDERLLIGLNELYRHPWLHSLGGKLSLLTFVVFVVFMLILLALNNG